MSRLQELEQKVKDLYEQKNETRADWADWLWENHVVVVADFATELAEQHGADKELSRAAALLHDIADARMKRADERHEQESLSIARQLLTQAGYSKSEIELVVDDAIKNHSCHDGVVLLSLEGKVLSTVDSLVHLKTDFYIFATRALGEEGQSLEHIKTWVLKEIDRDFHDKVQFDEVREEVRTDYVLIKNLFFSLILKYPVYLHDSAK